MLDGLFRGLFTKNERTYVKSGDKVPVTGYYIYHGSPLKGKIPAYPVKEEKVQVLEKGNDAPYLEKMYNHVPALWVLVTEKKSTPLLHSHVSSKVYRTPINI